MKYRTKHVYLELLDADFLFVECSETYIKEAVQSIIAGSRLTEFLNKLEEFPIKTTTKGKTVFMDGGGSVIWLRKASNQVLLHESVHAAHHLLQDRGMPLSDSNDELYAYLISWLYEKISEVKAPKKRAK